MTLKPQSLIRLFILMAMLFSGLSFSQDPAYAKNKTAKKLSAKKMTKKSKSGIRFLETSQIAKLHPNTRIKYIRTLREAITDLEKFQRSIKPQSSFLNARVPIKKDIYAYLMGFAAYGEDNFEFYGQGLYDSDLCIYGGNFNKYELVRGRKQINPYGCEKPPSCQLGGASKGYSCSFQVFGLQGSDACLDAGNYANLTTVCNEKRLAVSDQNKQKADRAIQQAKNYFELDKVLEGSLSSEYLRKLSSDEAKSIISSLVDTQYNDDSFAHLIVISELYDVNNIEIPITSLNTAKQAEDLEFLRNLPRKVTDLNTATDDIYATEISNCARPLSPAVIAKIKDQDYLRSLTGSDRRQQLARIENYNATIAAGKTPNSYNTLQKPECIAFQSRLDRTKQRMDEVFQDLPIAPPVTQPDAPAGPQPELRSIGCPTSTSKETARLFQSSAMCLVCSMEKAVHNTSNDNEGKTYTSSRKWTALLSSMSLACGYGGRSGTSTEIPEMQKMIQTFGHCASESYDWESSDRRYERAIQEWQTVDQYRANAEKGKHRHQDFVDLKGKRIYPPDLSEAFYNVYGLSYAEATEIFCQDSTTDGRRSLEKAISRYAKKGKRKNNPVANDLATCMSESLNRAKTLYADGQNSCLASDDFERRYQTFYNQSVGNVPAGLVMHDGSDCSVTKQVEKTIETDASGRQGVRTSLALVDAKYIGEGSLKKFTVDPAAIARREGQRPDIVCYAPAGGGCEPIKETERSQVTYITTCRSESFPRTQKTESRRSYK